MKKYYTLSHSLIWKKIHITIGNPVYDMLEYYRGEIDDFGNLISIEIKHTLPLND